MTDETTVKDGRSRRGALHCMVWAGTGVLWGLVGEAQAANLSGFTFLQISDSHVGFQHFCFVLSRLQLSSRCTPTAR